MAVNAVVEWEIRDAGDDANGGGYNVDAGGGTDRSQQDAAHILWDGAPETATVHTTTTQMTTSTTPATTDIGNIVNITGGLASPGRYEIIAVNVGDNRYTLDRSCGTAGQSILGAMGGGAKTLASVLGASSSGNTFWFKATDTFTVAAVAEINKSDQKFRGYETAHGTAPTAANRPIIRATASFTGILKVQNSTILNTTIEDLILDGNNQGVLSRAIQDGGRGILVRRVEIRSCTLFGAFINQDGMCIDVYVKDCVAGGLSCGQAGSRSATVFYGCHVDKVTAGNGGDGDGFEMRSGCLAINCIATNCAGTGFEVLDNEEGVHLINCVAHTNTLNGFDIGTNGLIVNYINSVAYGNTGFGFDATTLANDISYRLVTCALADNGGTINYTPQRNVSQLTGLAADPALAAQGTAGGDYSLNNVAGGGAILNNNGVLGPISGSGNSDGSSDAWPLQTATTAEIVVVSSITNIIIPPFEVGSY